MSITDGQGIVVLSKTQLGDTLLISHPGHDRIVLQLDQALLERATVQMPVFELIASSPLDIEEVLISATKRGQARSTLPFQINAIKAEEASLYQPQTTADLLAASGHVYIQKSQLGGGSPMIRGFAANRVLLVVDGVRMNNAIFRSGNLQNVISLDPHALKGSEVISGPGSVIYGSDAIGGVMSFMSLDPIMGTADKTAIQGHAMLRYATANQEKSTHADIGLGGLKLGSLSSISFSDYEDLRMGKWGRDEYLRREYVSRVEGQDRIIPNENPLIQHPTAYRQINLMQKFRYLASPRLSLNYGFHYATTSHTPRYDRLIEYRNASLRSAEWYYGPQTLDDEYPGHQIHCPIRPI